MPKVFTSFTTMVWHGSKFGFIRMARISSSVYVFLTGVVSVLIFEHYVFEIITNKHILKRSGKIETASHTALGIKGDSDKKLQEHVVPETMKQPDTKTQEVSDTGKTKVYRFDGNRIIRLHEFCTWTVHYDCVMLDTSGSGKTPIHVHDLKLDTYVSRSIVQNGAWEPNNVRVVKEELTKDPESGFIDLGSHVGAFSLSMAKFGRKTVSVDPLIENVQRLCKSIQKGGFTNQMTIIFNPVSDDHRSVSFKRYADNVGGTSVVNNPGNSGQKSPCDEGTASPTVMLDDIIDYIPFKKAVMKMDVQEHEYRVLKGAARFFKQINVTAIMMEWDAIKLIPDGEKVITFLHELKFKAYEPVINGKELNFQNYKSWPNDILWKLSTF